jgi:hypothetical protein
LGDFERRRHLVPPARVFSNFLKLLIEEQVEIDKMFAEMVMKLGVKLPGFGEATAGDGKYLDSYANGKSKKPNPEAGNRAEQDAEWGVKEQHYVDKNGKPQVKKESHFGFKAHIICDVNTELPIAYNVLAANSDEKKAMMDIIANMPDALRCNMEYLLLDRGYDSIEMIRTLKRYDIKPIIDIRNCWKDGEATKQYKDTDIVYDYCGNVFIVDDKGELRRMHYEGYDRQKECLRYSYKGKMYKIYISYDERVFLPVARDSMKFKRLYKGRTSVERLNGRLDRDYMLKDHCIRGLKIMKLMVSLTLLTMNAMALGKIQHGVTKRLAALTKLYLPRVS